MQSLSAITSEFVGRISVAVWIGKLSEEAMNKIVDYILTLKK